MHYEAMLADQLARRLHIGAEVFSEGTNFCVWAPHAKKIEVVLEEHHLSAYELEKEDNGYNSVFINNASAGTNYRYRINGNEALYPDPASRYQPLGPHGPSQIVNSSTFAWSDQDWRALGHAAIVYPQNEDLI